MAERYPRYRKLRPRVVHAPKTKPVTWNEILQLPLVTWFSALVLIAMNIVPIYLVLERG